MIEQLKDICFVPEQCVFHAESGQIGIIQRKITTDVFEVIFGHRGGLHTKLTLTSVKLRDCSISEVCYWRQLQGFDAGRPAFTEGEQQYGY